MSETGLVLSCAVYYFDLFSRYPRVRGGECFQDSKNAQVKCNERVLHQEIKSLSTNVLSPHATEIVIDSVG